MPLLSGRMQRKTGVADDRDVLKGGGDEPEERGRPCSDILIIINRPVGGVRR